MVVAEEGAAQYVLEPWSSNVWQRDNVFPKPIINQDYWATSWPSSRQIKWNERWPLPSLRFFFSTNMDKRWLNGVWMHECAHGDLCERMHELMSHCDEKLNDPSATQYIFIVQMCGWRWTVPKQYLTSESRRHSTLLIQTTVMVHYVAALWELDDMKHVRVSRLHAGLHIVLNVWLCAVFYTQLQAKCNIIFQHVCLPTQCGWEKWYEKDRLARKVWGGWRVTVPLGLIVEARLNGARAGKVSAQQGQKKRKYCSCMEGRYLTPHSMLCSAK